MFLRKEHHTHSASPCVDFQDLLYSVSLGQFIAAISFNLLILYEQGAVLGSNFLLQPFRNGYLSWLFCLLLGIPELHMITHGRGTAGWDQRKVKDMFGSGKLISSEVTHSPAHYSSPSTNFPAASTTHTFNHSGKVVKIVDIFSLHTPSPSRRGAGSRMVTRMFDS